MAAGGRSPRTTHATAGTGAATSRARRAACTGSRSGWRHTRRRQSIPGLVRLEPDGRRGPHRARHPGCARPGAAMGNHGAPACGRAITVAPARVTAALVILGGCFWALSQLLTRTHGFGVRDLVWGWHSADLRRSTRAGTSERSGARTQAAPYHSRLLRWCGCFSTDVNDI